MYATLACTCEQKIERVQKRVRNLTIYSEYTLTYTHPLISSSEAGWRSDLPLALALHLGVGEGC